MHGPRTDTHARARTLACACHGQHGHWPVRATDARTCHGHATDISCGPNGKGRQVKISGMVRTPSRARLWRPQSIYAKFIQNMLQRFQSIMGVCEFFYGVEHMSFPFWEYPEHASFSLSGSIHSEIMRLYIRMYHLVPLHLLYERIKAQSSVNDGTWEIPKIETTYVRRFTEIRTFPLHCESAVIFPCLYYITLLPTCRL